MDWASYRSNWVRRFVEPPPVVLVRRGHLIGRNLRRELVTIPELMASLRAQGVDKLTDVKIARMEPDGGISVIRANGKDRDTDPPPQRERSPLA
jgi:uncharacterized membrane protein YcaP (DUF421 family)